MTEIWILVPKQLLTLASSSDLDLFSQFKEITGQKSDSIIDLGINMTLTFFHNLKK